MRRLLATALVVAVFAAAFWLGFLHAPDALAIKCNFKTTYYSDASHTTVVGVEEWKPQACGCFYTSGGSVTSFKVTVASSCLD